MSQCNMQSCKFFGYNVYNVGGSNSTLPCLNCSKYKPTNNYNPSEVPVIPEDRREDDF